MLRAAPFLFVLLWSSAFVATRAGLEDASPLFFLTARFAIAAVVLFAASVFLRTGWSRLRGSTWHLAVAGALINGLYLSGVYFALERIPASTMALIGGLHPLITGLLGWAAFKERLSLWQWTGLVLGLCGVALVVGEQAGRPADLLGPLSGFAGVVCLAVGTLYYRKFCRHVPLRSANMVQLSTAAVLCGILTSGLEPFEVTWSANLVATLLYLALVVSLGAPALLMLMLRHNKAAMVASNFYLTPALTAGMGWLFLGETLDLRAVAGIGVAMLGVWLAHREEAGHLRSGVQT